MLEISTRSTLSKQARADSRFGRCQAGKRQLHAIQLQRSEELHVGVLPPDFPVIIESRQRTGRKKTGEARRITGRGREGPARSASCESKWLTARNKCPEWLESREWKIPFIKSFCTVEPPPTPGGGPPCRGRRDRRAKQTGCQLPLVKKQH